MSRYVKSDALMEDICSLYRDEDHIDYNVAIADALNVIDEQPTVDIPQWIPCSERLPEKDTNVLGYIRCASFDYMNVLWRDDYSGDWADGDNFHHEVIAWMPLPKPWKGEADG